MPEIIQTQKEISDLSNFEKGLEFEDFIVSLFNKNKFRLLDWRSDKRAKNGAYPLSSLNPDLEFDYRGIRGSRFAVECKWRKCFYSDTLHWAYEDQIRTYCDYQSQNAIPVFVAIGVGGQPSDPELLFITPLDNISMYTTVYRSRLIRFRRNPKVSIDHSEQLRLFS